MGEYKTELGKCCCYTDDFFTTTSIIYSSDNRIYGKQCKKIINRNVVTASRFTLIRESCH